MGEEQLEKEESESKNDSGLRGGGRGRGKGGPEHTDTQTVMVFQEGQALVAVLYFSSSMQYFMNETNPYDVHVPLRFMYIHV